MIIFGPALYATMDTSIMSKTDRQAFHYIRGVLPEHRWSVPRHGAATLGRSVSASSSVLVGNVFSLFELFIQTLRMFVLQ